MIVNLILVGSKSGFVGTRNKKFRHCYWCHDQWGRGSDLLYHFVYHSLYHFLI